MIDVNAYTVKKPNWDTITPEEAKILLRENTRKIVELEERFGMMKWSDYQEISQRLFEEKRRLENRIENPYLPKKENIIPKRKINQHKGLSEEDCQKLLDKQNANKSSSIHSS